MFQQYRNEWNTKYKIHFKVPFSILPSTSPCSLDSFFFFNVIYEQYMRNFI